MRALFPIIAPIIALLLLAPATGAEHIPKPLNIEADLSEERLELSLLIDALLFRHWTGIDGRGLLDIDEDAFAARCAEVAEFLTVQAPVAIDGIDVRPVVEDIALEEGIPETDFIDFVSVIARYGVKGRPGAIEFTWSRFDSEDSFPLEAAYLVFSTEDDFQVLRFRQDDPTRLWRRPGAPAAVDPEEVAPGVPPPGGELPVAAVAALALAAALAFALRVRRSPVPRVVLVITVGLVAAYLLAPVAVVEFRWPGEAAVALPPEPEARALFESLHRNIYRAFDYRDEGQVYDALARSLAPALIDAVYGEVYRSLRMQLEQEEVAACQIRAVRILEDTVELPPAPDEPAYDVIARWEVIGTVRHWGHGHWRTNRYSARYRVRWAPEDGWRIGAVEILGQERVDDGREAAL